jgi:multisubunit Na+/H+ antiporter MnhB subunit
LSLRISGTQLLLLIANLGAGLGIYLLRTKLAGIAAPRVTMQGVWDSLLAATTAAATTFSRRWQNGSIDWYFSGTWLFVVGLATYALAYHGISLRSVSVDLSQIQWYGTLLCAMLASSAVMVVRFTTRVAAAIALTTNGFLTALLFVVYRSPDIVLTQILIETASTIFILLILYFLPPFKHDEFTAIRRFVNMAISVAVGATMFVLVLLITSPEFRERHNLALDYLSRSLADAGGANAVNVIIVDFRAIDTTGEITVLMMVSLIVFGLLRSRRRSAAATASPPAAPRPARPADGSPILRTAARLAMPLTAWVSLVIFLQGHNLPGGGFIAGAMGAAAGATYLLAFGLEAAERVSWWRVATIGLLISVATGAVPFVFGGAYMDHSILHLHLPLVGPYELPTATFFDLGVYLIVLGTIMTMFVELGLEDD